MPRDPARHEALTDTAWDEARARATIEAIAADVDAAFDEQALWRRIRSTGRPARTTTSACITARRGRDLGAGVPRRARRRRDPRVVAASRGAGRALSRGAGHRAGDGVVLGLGEVGVLLAAWRLDRDAVDVERLYRLIETN